MEASLPLRPAEAPERAALEARGPDLPRGVPAGDGPARRARRPAGIGGRYGAVDAAYPLYGRVELDPPQPLAGALAERDGLPGAVVSATLLTRLGAPRSAT